MNLYYCVFKWTALGNEERAQIFFCKLSLLLGLTGFKLISIVNCTMSLLHFHKSFKTACDFLCAEINFYNWYLCCSFPIMMTLVLYIHFSDTSYNTVNFHFKALHKVFLRSEMYWCGMKILICSYILKTNKCLSIPRWWKRVNFDNNWNGR